MRRRITTIFLVILLISGIGVMAYPFISSRVNASSQTHVIENYMGNVSEMSEKEIQEAKEKAEYYNQTEISSGTEDPFGDESKANTASVENASEGQSVDEGSYANILNVGTIMGYLEIPKIKISIPIYHGTSELVMQEGAGHMEGTAMPIGGNGTHCVLASHSGLTDAKLFTDLNKLAIGDKFYLYVLNETLTYQVDQIEVVLPADTSKLEAVPDKDYVTLLTCTPIGTNTHRLLVRGIRVPNDKEEIRDQSASADEISNETILSIIWWILPLMAVGFALFVIGMKKITK